MASGNSSGSGHTVADWIAPTIHETFTDLVPWDWGYSDPFFSSRTRIALQKVTKCYARQFLLFLGIPGNVLSGVVFWKQGLSDRVNVLLFSLAVADLGNLVGHLCFLPSCYLSDRLQASNWAAIANTKIACVILWASSVSQTLLVIVSVDRCLCVSLPIKARRLLTYRPLLTSIVLAHLLPLIVFLPAILASTVQWRADPSTNRSMAYMDTTPWFPVDIRLAGDIVTYFSLVTKPVFLLTVLASCVITIVSLRRASRKREWLVGRQTEEGEDSGDNRITRMLLCLCVVYVIVVFLDICSSIAVAVFPEYNVYRKYHNTSVVVYEFVWFASCLNSTINIFAYLLLSSRFRRTVKELGGCLRVTVKKKTMDDQSMG